MSKGREHKIKHHKVKVEVSGGPQKLHLKHKKSRTSAKQCHKNGSAQDIGVMGEKIKNDAREKASLISQRWF